MTPKPERSSDSIGIGQLLAEVSMITLVWLFSAGFSGFLFEVFVARFEFEI